MLLNIILRVGKLNYLAHSDKRSTGRRRFCWWKDTCNLAADNSYIALSNLFEEVPWQPVPSTTATDYGHSAGKTLRQGTQLGCQAWISPHHRLRSGWVKPWCQAHFQALPSAQCYEPLILCLCVSQYQPV